MSSIISELQQLASNSKEPISDLLRKALIVASKLGMDDFKDWINSELNGYTTFNVPKYRLCLSEYYIDSPHHGLLPVSMPNSETQKKFCVIYMTEPVDSLQHAMHSKEKNPKGFLRFPIPPEAERFLRNNGDLPDFPLVRLVSPNALSSALDGIRTVILNWALKLEQEGILGEGMSFSTEEKHKAHASQVINIENFSGILGSVSGGQILQNIQTQINKDDFASLAAALTELGIDQDDIGQLNDALKDDPVPQQTDKFGPKVAKWLGTMVQKAAQGTLKVGVDVAGKVISEALLVYSGLKT